MLSFKIHENAVCECVGFTVTFKDDTYIYFVVRHMEFIYVNFSLYNFIL